MNSAPTAPELPAEDVRVGATIREMRQMRGMTQDDLSRAATMSRSYVANIEAGRKRPSAIAVARIAAALHVPQISIIALADDAA
ncbi:MAG TPA: helix-turn-helix transcriptional regulator [Micropruina sp.]|nr:helix-turn-helix transcriptional regulator [Micropruina sp.]